MARSAKKPWWWEARKSWFVIIRNVRHNLGPDKKEAERQFHALMAASDEPLPDAVSPPQPTVPQAASVAELLDKFLAWCQRHRAPLTYSWYRDILQSFAGSLADATALPAADLRPFHIVEWADKQDTWSATSRRHAMAAVQRAYNWAEEMGHIEKTPIKKVAKPSPSRRDNHVTPEDFAQIMSHVPDVQFRDLLTFAWHSGCRPQEARHIESRHVDLAGTRIVIPKEEAKGKKRARIIHLNAVALEIIARLLSAHPEGKLFLNVDGNPWQKSAICCRFYRLKKKLGKKFAAYDLRHGFCQRLLEGGTDHLTVAELMGHSNGQMVSTTYSHMNRADAHLKEALKKASGADGGA